MEKFRNNFKVIIMSVSLIIIAACTKYSFNPGKEISNKALSVLSVSPSDNSQAIAVDAKPQVKFSNVIDTGSVTTETFYISKGTTRLAGSIDSHDSLAIFIPAVMLEPSTEYICTITQDVMDADGNFMSAMYSWTFKTAEAVDITPPVVNAVNPAPGADSIPVNVNPTVSFSEVINPATITSSSFTLKQGTSTVTGTVSASGASATLTPSSSLLAGKVYTATITTAVKDTAGNSIASNYSWSFTTTPPVDRTPPTVLTVNPASNATSVSTGVYPSVTFSEAISSSSVTTSTFQLKRGSTAVAGSVSVSGSTATFNPSAALVPGTVYTATVTTGVKDITGNALASNYTWSFTTSALADITPPTVVSVTPASNATAVATSARPTATFSEAISAASITTSTFQLKQGSTVIAGSVSLSGSTATFTPSSSLAAGTVYTMTITTGVKDNSGNALASNYSWSFTTAQPTDVTPPTVVSVSPASNATSVATGARPSVTFSEAMSPTSVNTTTFLLKNGSSSVAGTVSVSGSTATFTPSAALAAGTVYTVTITTGVKDNSGNALAANYSWSFTTVAAATGKSFAADVVPVLNLCNTCHTHGWTPSTNPSTFHSNLLNAGYISTTSPTTGKIYKKISSGHPSSVVSSAQKTTVITWINEGSKNN